MLYRQAVVVLHLLSPACSSPLFCEHTTQTRSLTNTKSANLTSDDGVYTVLDVTVCQSSGGSTQYGSVLLHAHSFLSSCSLQEPQRSIRLIIFINATTCFGLVMILVTISPQSYLVSVALLVCVWFTVSWCHWVGDEMKMKLLHTAFFYMNK